MELKPQQRSGYEQQQHHTSCKLASFAFRSCSAAQDFSSWRTTSSAMLHSTPTCMHGRTPSPYSLLCPLQGQCEGAQCMQCVI